MRDPKNIAEVATLLPDYMGFIFVESSPRFIGSAFDIGNLDSIASITKKIGVFSNQDVMRIAESVARFGLDGVQLHGEESRNVVGTLRSLLPRIKIIKAISVHSVSSFELLQQYEDVVDFFLLDGKEPGSGKSFDWSILESYPSKRDFFLAGGVGANDIHKIRSLAARLHTLRGIDINSEVETSPGVKNIELIREVLEGVRV